MGKALAIGVPVGVAVVAAAVFLYQSIGNGSGTSAITDESAAAAQPEDSDIIEPSFDQEAWVGQLKDKLSRDEAESIELYEDSFQRDLLVVMFSYRDSPVYEERVLAPFFDVLESGLTELGDERGNDPSGRVTFSIGFLANTWVIAGPNPEYASRFERAAISASIVDDLASQSAALILLEEIARDMPKAATPEGARAIRMLRKDAANTDLAERMLASFKETQRD